MTPKQRAKSEQGQRDRGVLGYWDAHPQIRDLAARLIAAMTPIAEVQEAIGARCGASLVPTRSAVSRLRMGLAKDRWSFPTDEVPAEHEQVQESSPSASESALPEQAQAMLTYEPVERCLQPGSPTISKYACLKRQCSTTYPRYRRPGAGTNKSIQPHFIRCRKCKNWLTDEDYEIVTALVKKGLLPSPKRRNQFDRTARFSGAAPSA